MIEDQSRRIEVDWERDHYLIERHEAGRPVFQPMWERYRKAALFVGLTYLVSFLLVLLYKALVGQWTMPNALVLAVVYMFVPSMVAVIVQKRIFKEPLKEPLRISFRLNRWFLAAWLLPPLIACASLGVALLLPGVSFSPEMEGMVERFGKLLIPEQIEQMRNQARSLPIHPFWISLGTGLIAGITVNAVAAFGEELGWRGLLLRELEPLGFWRSSALIGLIWGFWHAPLILHGHNYPEHPWTGVFLMTATTVLLSPMLAYLTIRANSVLAAAIFHGTFNATAGLAIVVIRGGNDLTIGVTGLAGLAVLAVMSCGLFAFDRRVVGEAIGRHLGRNHSPSLS
jgi:membrane protease YdiL (CAAX protease family)